MKKNARIFLPLKESKKEQTTEELPFTATKEREVWSVGERLALSKEESHRLIHVLRINNGSIVKAICQKTGATFDATVLQENPCVEIILQKLLSKNDASNRLITCVLPLIKGERTDWAVEKLCELGAAEIRIYVAERSIARFSPHNLIKRLARWSNLAEQAARQCQRTSIPNISSFPSLNDAICDLKGGIFGCLDKNTQPINLVPTTLSQISFVVGPEGDFTPAEIELLKRSDLIPVSLGPLILRSETAAIAMMTIVSSPFFKTSQN